MTTLNWCYIALAVLGLMFMAVLCFAPIRNNDIAENIEGFIEGSIIATCLNNLEKNRK
jgi:hypothetical protein